jgi:3-dehydrotetronate 4-kinase
MPISLGVIADDYTGASDLANVLTRNGLSTVQTIGTPAAGLELPEVDAIVVALKSRSIAAGDAIRLSLGADRWLRARGARHVLFKVCSTFDSTDAGNIGPVVDALAAECGESLVLVTPAFPEARRTVYLGHLFAGSQLLSESPMKDHPLNPMRDPDLVRVLSRQSSRRVGLADLGVVEQEEEALRARCHALAESGFGAAIADAIFDRHLETIGRVAATARLSAGASGLGIGIARAMIAYGRIRPKTGDVAAEPAGGPAVCLAGSCSQATLAQIERAKAVMPVLHLDVDDVLSLGCAVEAAIAWAGERIALSPVLIASSQDAASVSRIQNTYGRERAGHAIEAAMAAIAEAVVARGVLRLVVAGGETSGAVVDRLGIPAFLIGQEIAPGVPVLHTTGGAKRMALALKSGNFGGQDFFADALRAIP